MCASAQLLHAEMGITGVECLLTLRDTSDEALFSRMKQVLPHIEAKLEARRQAQQQAQANQNGQQPAPPAEENYCHYHDAP